MDKIRSKPIIYLIFGIIVLFVILIISLAYSYNQSLTSQINILKVEKTELQTKLDLQNAKIEVITSKFLPNYAVIITAFENSFNSMNLCIGTVTAEQIKQCEQAKTIFDSSKTNYSQKINENLKIIKDNNLSN